MADTSQGAVSAPSQMPWDSLPPIKAVVPVDAAPQDSASSKMPWDSLPPVKTESSISDKWKGANETLTTLLTGVPAQIAGNIAGLFHAVTNPSTYGTPEGVAAAAQRAREVTDNLTYQPKTETGQNMIQTVGKVLDESKIAGLNPATAIAAPLPSAGRFVVNQVKTVANDVKNTIKSFLPETAAAPEMAGVGAAETADAALRRARAAELPTPIELTKGQAERTFEQQKFEKETAKLGIGQPLREKFAEQNGQVLQNFDHWVDQTGAEAPTLRASGSIVDSALVDKVNAAKARIKNAYTAAQAAGETRALVPTDDLVGFLNDNRPAAINAPVLTSAEQKLVQLGGASVDKNTGELVPARIAINDMEELRKFIGKVSGSDRTNIKFGTDAKNVIDGITEGGGGDLYNRARLLRTQFANEFENKGVINKLISFKPGTTDRAVALEDVFGHSVLNGSLDDVRAVRGTLQTAGPNGLQAWKELQGQTVNYIKEQATKNVSTDIKGNKIISAPALDKTINSLDKDGKLDFIFGRQGAQQLRDINDIAKDIYTAPPGSVNSSNTSSALLESLGNMAVGRLPTAAAKIINVTKEAIQTRKLRAQIGESMAPQNILDPEIKRRQGLGYER